MTYPIWIGADIDGRAIVGAREIDRRDSIVATERIYPSQMDHRVTARIDGKIRIMTPTEARDSGAEIIQRFPRADGRLRRGQ
jgi:hypothetical protein